MKVYALLFSLLLTPMGVQAACYGDQAMAKAPLMFTPVPQLPASTLFSRWVPVLDSIGKSTNQCFELVIKASIPDFEKYLLKDSPALAYVNPYHAVMAHKAKDYQPIIADGSLLLTGILVTKKRGWHKTDL